MSNLKQDILSSATIREEHAVITERDATTGIVVYEEWCRYDKLHRAAGPSHIERDPATGIVIYEAWYKHDRPHRADGPAVIERNAATGAVTCELWFNDGEQFAPPSDRAK